MRSSAKPPDLAPKKRPVQDRSRETFEALVTAATGLLAARGYAGTTTNHIAERAGVNIASLYEYFPGKDAIVAQVAERLVQRVLARLAEGLPRVMAARRQDAIRRWVELIHDTLEREKALVSVFLYQVPYTQQIPAVQAIGERLLRFSHQVRERAGGFVRADFSDASMHLVIHLVTSTILQSVFDPPQDVSRRELLDELVRWIEERIRA
jgi:AcrR family transcriptional regulator